MSDDLINFLYDRRKSNEFYADGLRAMAPLLPVDTGNLLVEVAGRLEREAAAQKRIVELHAHKGTKDGFAYCATCGSGEPYEYPAPWPCETLRLLAEPHADHPDYHAEWRLDEASSQTA